ncbi:MAG TPA: putative 2OG-Fe(II) oxygenase, partial [Kiloniellaceae bacterium]|nr:putative 2OG-Fe(II) oxygenase [Kiloniellaceae bacterium]
AAFRAATVEHILQHPSLKADPAGLSTRDGRHTGELLVEPKGPIAAFERLVVEAVVAYARSHPVDPASSFLAAQPSRWSLNIWAVVLGSAGYQAPHLHPAGWLSGVFYLAVPPEITAADNRQRGWIEFGRPPQLPDWAALPTLKTVAPEEGLMLLFPSYLHHRTIPSGQEALRISLAFDVLPHDQSPR